MIGKTLAHYEITEKLGMGGMGEVFRARDTKLERDVAIKVLPTAMSRDPERVLRFQREARALAALNHVNIGAIYGFEEVGDVRFLVLELIEGDTLADRLKAGPLPVDETLAIGKQIAEALEAAHASGIVHRDLKPANIKVDAEGHVKVLDFGLAKALSEAEPSVGATDAAASPTITADFTRPGVILGTAAYMSPEQARGRPIDKRTDIFSFGCVLYQCLTGQIVFAGETVTDSIGAILHKQPDWDAVPPHTPPTVQLLLRRCLAKDRKQRLHDIADARLELETAIADPTSSALKLAGVALAEAQHRPRRRVAALASMFVVGAALTAVVTQSLQPKPPPPPTLPPPPPPPPVQRLSVVLPQRGDALQISYLRSGFDVSADGSQLVYGAASEEGPFQTGGVGILARVAVREFQLYVRPLDQPAARPLPGTQGAYGPVFSPDAQWIAYYDVEDRVLKKISIHGGPPTTLCDVPTIAGMTWTTDGYIVYCRQANRDVLRVGENGGEPKVLVGQDEREASFDPRFPHVLPDASAVLFSADGGQAATDVPSIKAYSLATGQTTDLVSNATFPLYSESGHLLFLRGSTLMAAPFDARRLELTGPAVPFVERVSRPGRFGAHVRITRAGTLFFLSGGGASALRHTLVALGRQGVPTPLTERIGIFDDPVLSPDGTRIAVEVVEVDEESIWLLDIEKDLLSLLTPEPGRQMWPAWSPDGRWVYYVVYDEESKSSIFRRRADRGGEREQIYTQPRRFALFSVHPNGRQLLIHESGSEEHSPGTGSDIAVINLDDEPSRKAWLATPSNEGRPALSPNGQWVAWMSDESDDFQVYVRPFATEGAPVQVSRDGGIRPFWSRDGRTLFFLFPAPAGSTHTLMAANVRVGTTQPAATPDGARPTRLDFETPEKLFDLPAGPFPDFSAFPDGERFLALVRPTYVQNDPAVIHVMLNAHERLKEIAPVPED